MSTQICRVVELMMRSACCQTIRSRPCLHKAVLAPVGPSGLCAPGVPLLHRRAYSLDSRSLGHVRPSLGPNSQQPHAERTSPSSALTHRKLSAVAVQGQYHPLCRYDFLDIGDVEENVSRVRACKKPGYFIVDPDLAKVITQHLAPEDARTVIFEINPGLGVLTKTLLNAGAQRVVALEGNKPFLYNLQELEGCLDGQLQVVHCNYFKLDPMFGENIKPPLMSSDKLFNDLGITEASWTDDIRVKVVGIVPYHKQRHILLRMVYTLFEQLSVYRYGRIELNLFITEHEYQKMIARPGDMARYRHFCVLWQMACDIELLHKVPSDSFGNFPRRRLPNDNLCLVRLRPRADLFSAGLTPTNSLTMVMMVKQLLSKRKSKLIDKLNVWSPDSGSKLLSEMGLPQDILTGHVYPEEYLQLFQMMDKSQEFKHSWLYHEIPEIILGKNWG